MCRQARRTRGSEEPGRAVISLITLRAPELRDGQGLWRLAKASRTLDTNSPYAYLMACRHFRDTTVVASDDSGLCGFVVAYRPPTSPDAVFVWQIGVVGSQQGKGIGARLLDELLARDACRDVRFLEATVTPSNTASKRLFHAFAARHGAEVAGQPCFLSEDFPEPGHEEEILLRIGPLAM